ncbi:hypothetical protein [Desulfoluna butyratoxydans]|uniref:Uncharacterized protein n=1 Tax=Desulfoluna butyratoxydans TaxID=231438 RepID=A0A4U8YHH0_9BACT|nr:hypothetical protein [Desulfoluna butyratoxydans]VFQ43016.1 hypothetical protein MSL71_6380 [Desulfoluna butyratoxydans]
MDHGTIKKALADQLKAARRETLSGLLWGGLLAVVGYVGAGIILKCVVLFCLEVDQKVVEDWFWRLYGGFFVLLMVVGFFYQPRTSYDFGMKSNPFSQKDDMERAHMTGGFILALPHFTYHYLRTLLGYFFNAGEQVDLNLAAGLLAHAAHPHYTVSLKNAYASNLPKKTVDGTLITLEDTGVVSISRQRGLMTLTLKGREMVGRDPVTKQAERFMLE